MAIYNIPNLTSGLDDALVNTIAEVPIFTPMFLLFVFGIVLLGGMAAQKKREGTMDMPMWATIASLSTFMISLPLTLREGLIDIFTLSVVVSITVMSGIWLFLDRNRREV